MGQLPHGDAEVTAKYRLFWFAAGLSCVAIVAVFAANSARAQAIDTPEERPDLRGTDPASYAGRPGSASRRRSNFDPLDESGGADLVPRGDPSRDPQRFDDPLDPSPRPGQRAVVQDGDLTYPSEPSVVYDGLGEQPEPVPLRDGIDPTRIDTRTREDIAVFEDPPAGYNPRLFQIEDVDPVVTDRLPRQLAEIEPYDPVGIRLGSFVYFPEIEVSGVATNNVFRSPLDLSDIYAEVASEQRLVSNWATHALELRATGLLNFHNDFPGEDDREWGVEGRARVDITRRTNLQGLLSHDVSQESRSAIDASTTGDRPEVIADRANLTFNHQFNRLSVQLRGSHTALDFSDTGAGATLQINDDRDSRTNEEAVRVQWESKPTFSVFAEAAINQRTFDAPAQSDLIRRDSDGERWRFGVDFGNSGEILRGEASIGWGRQSPDDARLAAADAFLFDANVAWRINGLTSLLVSAQTDFFDTTTAGSPVVVAHTVGTEVRHAFRRHLIGTAGLSVSQRDYASIPLVETELRTTAGAEYFVNREFILFGQYQHIAFESNSANGDYHADDFRLGLRWRR